MVAIRIRTGRLVDLIPYGLFFLFTFLYFLIFASHIFYFQEKSSLFILSSDFLSENLQEPGGILVYLSTLLTSLGYIPFLGSLISSAILLLILITSSLIISKLAGKNAGPFPYLIAAALFFLQCNYQYLLINNTDLLLQLVLFYFLIRKPAGWLPVIIIPFWYYLTGGFAIVFAIMYLFRQVTERPPKYMLRTVAFLLTVFITFFVSSEILFFRGSWELLSSPWSPGGTGNQVFTFTGATAALCLIPVFALIINRGSFKIKVPFQGSSLILSGSGLLIVLLFVIAVFRYDKKTLDYFRVEKMFVENRYEDLTDFNIKNPTNNKLTLFLNNIALNESGRLNDLLFHFQQGADGSTLFLKWEIVDEIIRRGGYFYYCTGMINEAHRWAYEYLVMKGFTPEGLKMLIKTDLINGNYKTADRYNRILSKTIFYRKDAKRFGRLITSDDAVKNDPELGSKQRIKVARDWFTITDDPEINIERVIATDSLNRMAFEYKIAWLLVSKNYQGIAAEWANLGRYGFKSIPVHLEEAGVALKSLYNVDLPVTGNLQISKATEERFIRFLQTFQSYGSSLQVAEPALRRQFGNTFWYYVFYK